MEKFLIVAMEPGGVSRFLSADGHGRGIDLIAFPEELRQEQAVLSVTVFRSAAEQQGEGAPGCQQAVPAYRKAHRSVPAAVVPVHSFPLRDVVGAPGFLNFDIENDHVCLRIFLKFCQDRRFISVLIHNICIRKKADISFCPQNSFIPASADAPVREAIETDGSCLSVFLGYLHFFLPESVALVDDHRIGLQIHMLYGFTKRSVHYRCQYFYLHACSPSAWVVFVCSISVFLVFISLSAVSEPIIGRK